MKTNFVGDYLSEVVTYGGIRMPRHQMITHLTKTAKATGRADWSILVDRYLQGHELMRRGHTAPQDEKPNGRHAQFAQGNYCSQ